MAAHEFVDPIATIASGQDASRTNAATLEDFALAAPVIGGAAVIGALLEFTAGDKSLAYSSGSVVKNSG